jgi:hypothetical protein
MEEQRRAAEHQQRMLQELLKQQHIRHEQEKKMREEYQKHMQKQLLEQQKHHQHLQKELEERMKHQPPSTKPGTPAPVPKGKAPPPGSKSLGHLPPPITVKQLPSRGQVCRALKMALSQVHAEAKLRPEPKQMAMISISQALIELGEAPPMPPPPLAQKGDHIRWAREDLQTAHRGVINARHLPPPVKVPVLAEIQKALHFLSYPDWPYPNMGPARKQLIEALHQVHAAGLEVRAKEMALRNIREALHVLGEVSPAPIAPSQNGERIRLAEEHLYKAYKDVVEAKHLPPEQRMPALWEIHNAMFALRHPAQTFPDLKEAKDQLVYALHQVHAAPIPVVGLKELALTNIGEAIRVLGENPPRAWDRYEKRDHIHEAEMHHHKARADVDSKKLLPLREFVLEKISVADMALKEAANPGKAVAAPK